MDTSELNRSTVRDSGEDESELFIIFFVHHFVCSASETWR
jgi:hypothetical protein